MTQAQAEQFKDKTGYYPSRYWAEKLGNNDCIIPVCLDSETTVYKSVTYQEKELFERTK